MRLIDADELYDAILDTYEGSRIIAIDDVLEFIDDSDMVESKDFVQRVHGKMDFQTSSLDNEHEYDDYAKCSRCKDEFLLTGEWTFEDYLYYMHFCPNCGTKMDLEEENVT